MVMENQLSMFFLACFLLHRTWNWAALLALSILFHWVTLSFGLAASSMENYGYAVREFLDRPGNYRLQPLNITPFIEPNIADHLPIMKGRASQVFREKGTNKVAYQPIRAFFVKTVKPPFPSQLKAFCHSMNSSLLFLRDDPITLGPLGKFKLYHELGHLTTEGIFLWAEHYAAPPRLIPMALSLFACVGLSWWSLALLPYALYLNLKRLFIRDVIVEVQADTFAFGAIRNRETLKQVLADLDDLWAEDVQRVPRSTPPFKNVVLKARLRQLRYYRLSLANNKLPNRLPRAWSMWDLLFLGLFTYVATTAHGPGTWFSIVFLLFIAYWQYQTYRAIGVGAGIEKRFEEALEAQALTNDDEHPLRPVPL